MKLIGRRETFGIEYEFRTPPVYDEYIYEWSLWGCVYFWVNGRNLFAHKDQKPTDTYHWDLYYLTLWFCENLKFILDSRFPLNISGNSLEDMIQKFDSILENLDEDSDEYFELSSIFFNWAESHFIDRAHGGSWLPDIALRTIDNYKMEISWDNTVRFQGEDVKMLYNSGLEHINKKDFFNVVTEFCKDVIVKAEKDKNKSIEEIKSTLELKTLLNESIETINKNGYMCDL